MNTIRAITVDDEPLARERLRGLLAEEAGIELVAEAADGDEAVAAIRTHKPDLVLLDIQMPGLDGFGVLAKLPMKPLPVVIFVTAYDQYALRAFEVHALDYVLKPIDGDRFRAAMRRARDQIEREKRGEVDERVRALLSELRAPSPHLDRLAIRSPGRVFFVKTEEIDFIEAAGNYVRIKVGDHEHLLRETLNAMEQKLDPRRFVRIHRSTVVNVDRVKELQPILHGDYSVILRSGATLTLSRSFREKAQQALGLEPEA